MSILNKFSLHGKVALVTGASRGIGQSIAVAFAEAGAKVVLVAKSSSLKETENKIKAANGESISLKVDLTDDQAAKQIVHFAIERYGTIDIVVNNAGILCRKEVIDTSVEDLNISINTNIKAVYNLCQAVAPVMLNNNSGKIINISSINAKRGGANTAIYTTTKGAIVSLTQALAGEWGPKGINVNAILPGPTETDLTKITRENPDSNQMIIDKIPMGRWGLPEDIAYAAVFLASNASDFIQGVSLPVDGGLLIK